MAVRHDFDLAQASCSDMLGLHGLQYALVEESVRAFRVAMGLKVTQTHVQECT